LPRTKVPHIFITLAARSLPAMEAQAAQYAGSPAGMELRLDHLKETLNFEDELRQMLARLHFPVSIATCRRVEAGGLFEGSIEEQKEILKAAVQAGCQWVDLERESLKQGGKALLGEFQSARLIVSCHDYRKMPEIGKTYQRMSRLPVQIIKIAGHARQLRDNIPVFQALKKHKHRNPKLVAMAMGACGVPARLLALRYGSRFTYAAPNHHQAAAPGQLAFEVMKSIYRVERLDLHTQLYGVVGSRASVSLSPAMHNAAFQAKRENAIYLPCETDRLSDFLGFARQLDFQGFSVTMPFKQGIIRHLDWLDPLAAKIGACNTVSVRRGQWMGWNTDAAAVIEVLTKRLRLPGSRILVLGAGGAGRAAAYALRAEGAEVILSARRETAARRLARATSAATVPWNSSEGLDVDAVVNATPVGMAPYADSLPVDLSRLRVRVVFDMVYYPMETRLLADARGRGLTTISGLEMLVAQGARQFEIWTGETAPRALMEQAVRQALGD